MPENTLFWNIPERDPRIQSWFLVGSYFNACLVTVAYLTFVFMGQKVMRQIPPFSLKTPIFIYNFCIILLSAYIAKEIWLGVLEADYNLFCQPFEYDLEHKDYRVTRALWLFYLSKAVEFMDTVFFVLRKKADQITFLHVYHHTSIFVIWFHYINWLGGGTTWFPPFLNCVVHTVMYTYYTLSLFPTLRPYLWWKKYITSIQMTQFLLQFVYIGNTIRLGYVGQCKYSFVGAVVFEIYIVFMFGLFYNFYLKAYKKKSKEIFSDKHDAIKTE